MLDPNLKVLVTGGRGMVGSALLRALAQRGFKHVLAPTRSHLDLTEQRSVSAFIRWERPDVVIIAAAKVGGIHANSTYPADFLYENLIIATNVIQGSFRAGVERLLFLGSSCIYPKLAPQPMSEECLLTSPLEPTNEPYAIAKIAGLKLCQAYRKQHGVLFHSAMPTNLYGPGDNYHPDNSHVIPGLLRRFHEAKQNGDPEVVVWGTGTPRREFLHVDDLADACIHLLGLENPPDWINVGVGKDLSIAELAQAVKEVVGYRDTLNFDSTKPDGTPRKLLDVTKLTKTGWTAKIDFQQGLQSAYQAFLDQLTNKPLDCNAANHSTATPNDTTSI